MQQHRELITLSQLGEWITAEIQKNEDCEDVEIRVQFALQDADEDGCNWSEDLIINPGSSTAAIIGPNLDPILIQARKRFNIAG
jgi:hypothetical protein